MNRKQFEELQEEVMHTINMICKNDSLPDVFRDKLLARVEHHFSMVEKLCPEVTPALCWICNSNIGERDYSNACSLCYDNIVLGTVGD